MSCRLPESFGLAESSRATFDFSLDQSMQRLHKEVEQLQEECYGFQTCTIHCHDMGPGHAFGYFPMLSKEPSLVTCFLTVTIRFLDHMTLLSCDALCLVTASASLWGT